MDSELGKSRKEEVESAETICQKALGLLQDFAEKLRRIVCGELKTNAFALECEFRELRENPEITEMIKVLEEKK